MDAAIDIHAVRVQSSLCGLVCSVTGIGVRTSCFPKRTYLDKNLVLQFRWRGERGQARVKLGVKFVAKYFTHVPGHFLLQCHTAMVLDAQDDGVVTRVECVFVNGFNDVRELDLRQAAATCDGTESDQAKPENATKSSSVVAIIDSNK